MMRFRSHVVRAGTRLQAAIIALSLASAAPAAATAIGNGVPGPDAGFRLTEISSPTTDADGFQISYTTLTATASFSSTGNASALASLQPITTNGTSFLRIGANMDVTASATGEAFAAVTQHVLATITNILDESNSFNLFGFYGINTGISVDDLLHESVFATWNVGLEFDSSAFHEVRTVNCDLATFTPNACPNFFDNNSGSIAFVTLDPGESFQILLSTDMTLHAVAVPEPASIALLAVGAIAAAWISRRRRVRH